MTDELFREDARMTQCEARVLAVDAAGVRLDRTVFYPQGGGQAGDAGVLRLSAEKRSSVGPRVKFNSEQPGAQSG